MNDTNSERAEKEFELKEKEYLHSEMRKGYRAIDAYFEVWACRTDDNDLPAWHEDYRLLVNKVLEEVKKLREELGDEQVFRSSCC